ncbi:glutamate--cysteine ligase [Candidatus Riesia pthiripubis]|uniref:Glutamate--cysteine ligase n=1 Tax=Candidatus Riesia pthiripubis TaxID=428412 RepID=A0A1V0HP51_9ENTR|nr:glutamate--cysteine ligase [Candidatus Riesia pthiripubis]
MIVDFPNISKSIQKLENNPNVLLELYRGIERETLRINYDGTIAKSNHPENLGKPLTHSWITTDFSESLLEFVTPVSKNIEYVLSFLRDLYRHTAKNLKKELMWPFSMPCYVRKKEDILLAKYGSSNIGKFKTLYRKGLRSRYGPFMQIISGIHYNFSFSKKFWKTIIEVQNIKDKNTKVSYGYLCMIRNYYRFGWIIPYLFGSSPAVFKSYLVENKINFPFKKASNETYYLPYATSLRMSDFGYNKIKLKNDLKITFNNLTNYVKSVKEATKKSSPEFERISLFDVKGNRLQINTNILQTENELYIPIRPKGILSNRISTLDSILKNGIEYIEIRSLDVNPFNPIGVDKLQIYFLDLFLIWCMLADSPFMNEKELNCCLKNWNQVTLKGRKPRKSILMNCGTKRVSLKETSQMLMNDLIKLADLLDKTTSDIQYKKTCFDLVEMIKDPTLTFSGRILQNIQNGMKEFGLNLARKYHENSVNEYYEIINESDFTTEKNRSVSKQRKIEGKDKISFNEFLMKIQRSGSK